MPKIIEPVPYSPEPAPNPIRWTRRQCKAMLEIGFLTERHELIEGEILLKMGQNRPHMTTIILFITWLASLFGNEFI